MLEFLWMGLMRTLDAGTMGGDKGNWPILAAMLAITLGWHLHCQRPHRSCLTTGLEARLEELRKGRSRVLESDHTPHPGLVRGSLHHHQRTGDRQREPQKPRNRDYGRRKIIEMDEEIADRIENRGKTRIICRTGDPIDMTRPGDSSIPRVPARSFCWPRPTDDPTRR
jgi:hypothetical protein